MEYEVVVSVFRKGAPDDEEPIREEVLLETADLNEANALVEDAIELCEDVEDEEEDPAADAGIANLN